MPKGLGPESQPASGLPMPGHGPGAPARQRAPTRPSGAQCRAQPRGPSARTGTGRAEPGLRPCGRRARRLVAPPLWGHRTLGPNRQMGRGKSPQSVPRAASEKVQAQDTRHSVQAHQDATLNPDVISQSRSSLSARAGAVRVHRIHVHSKMGTTESGGHSLISQRKYQLSTSRIETPICSSDAYLL